MLGTNDFLRSVVLTSYSVTATVHAKAVVDADTNRLCQHSRPKKINIHPKQCACRCNSEYQKRVHEGTLQESMHCRRHCLCMQMVTLAQQTQENQHLSRAMCCACHGGSEDQKHVHEGTLKKPMNCINRSSFNIYIIEFQKVLHSMCTIVSTNCMHIKQTIN